MRNYKKSETLLIFVALCAYDKWMANGKKSQLPYYIYSSHSLALAFRNSNDLKCRIRDALTRWNFSFYIFFLLSFTFHHRHTNTILSCLIAGRSLRGITKLLYFFRSMLLSPNELFGFKFRIWLSLSRYISFYSFADESDTSRPIMTQWTVTGHYAVELWLFIVV